MLLCARNSFTRCPGSAYATLQFPRELFHELEEARTSFAGRYILSSARQHKGSHTRWLSTSATEDQASSRQTAPAKAPYRILFAGSDRFSCISLELLAKQDKNLVQELSVLVPPDKRTSRGLKQVHRPPLRILAENLGLQVYEIPPTGLRDFNLPPTFKAPSDFSTPSSTPTQEEVPDSNARNVLVTASFGYLVPQSILAQFLPLNTINVHPSLLPKYRGAAPIQWAIMNGDTETGMTIQTLGKKFDEGRILAQTNVTLGEVDYMTAEAQLGEVGARLLIDTLKDLAKRQEESQAQDSSKATFARKLSSEDAKVTWEDMTASQIARKHRGISHQYPLWTMVNGKRVQLLDVKETSAPSNVSDPPTATGVGYFDKKNKLIAVHCKDDTWLAVKSLKTEGRKGITADQWWIGIAKQARTMQLGP